MDKEKLPPIPTPVSQRWREFRIQILPLLVFIGIITLIVMLWKSFVQPIGIVGLAETNAVNVVSTQDGLLASLTVARFQSVTQHQDIGLLVNTDPELVKAQIAAAKADIEVLRERLKVDQDRTEQSYQQFRQDLFNLRVAQASDRVNWVLASNDLERASRELKTNIISMAQFESAQNKFDVLATNIAERAIHIQDLTRTLADLQLRRKAGSSDAFEHAIEAKQRELDLMLKPNTIRAPIDGVVSFVYHITGERVLRGMPIITITSPRAERIMGYIRQPIQSRPDVSDTVQVTTRSSPRQAGKGQILNVGAQLEPINPALLSADTKRMEVGLPIVISVPPGMHLLPGEFIDLFIVKAKK